MRKWIELAAVLLLLAIMAGFHIPAHSAYTALPFPVPATASIIYRCGEQPFITAISGYDKLQGTLDEITEEGDLDLLTNMLGEAYYYKRVKPTTITPAEYCI